METAKRPIIGGIQNRVEDLTYRARGEKVPEEKLKDVTEADKKAQVISLDDISGLKVNEITFDSLIAAGLIKKSHGRAVKILGSGEIKKPVVINKISVSKSAKLKIEAAGGKVL